MGPCNIALHFQSLLTNTSLCCFTWYQRFLIDAPALVDLGHGTVRYREDGTTNPVIQKQTDVKTGYFYHSRLDDYSEGKVVVSFLV